MIVRIKKLSAEAVIPTYAKEGDAGMDLVATDVYMDHEGNLVCETGLSMEIPEGHVGYIFPRSSISKKILHLANSVGVIDSGYRGPIMVKFKPTNYFMMDAVSGKEQYKKGDRVAQIIIMPIPYITFEEVNELSQTIRGEAGFGSTGN